MGTGKTFDHGNWKYVESVKTKSQGIIGETQSNYGSYFKKPGGGLGGGGALLRLIEGKF